MDYYDVKMTSQDLKPKQEHVQYHVKEATLKEKMAVSLENFRAVVGDGYYDAFDKKSNEMDEETAGVFGGRLGACIGRIGVAMQKGLPVDSAEVQTLVEKQWEAMKMVYPDTSSKRVFLAIRDQTCFSPMSQEIPETAPFCEYLSQAMEVFSQSHFSEE